MNFISRLYTFINGTKADAPQVNAEFDSILDFINAEADRTRKLTGDSIQVGSIPKDRLVEYLSELFQDSVTTKAELPTGSPEGEVRYVVDEQALYAYDAATTAWVKIASPIEELITQVNTNTTKIDQVDTQTNTNTTEIEKRFKRSGDFIDVGTATNPSEVNGGIRFASDGTAGSDGAYLQYAPATDSTNTANQLNITSKYAGNLDKLRIHSELITQKNSNGEFEIFTEENLKPYYINALDHGIDNTGSRDTTADIQALFDATAEGETIFFPTGTYVITEVVVTKTIDIVGAGRRTVFLKAAQAPSSNAMLRFQRADDATKKFENLNLRDFVIDGNRTNQTNGSYGLTLRGVHSGVVQNVMIQNVNGTGFFLDAHPNTGGAATTNTRLVDCWTLNNEGYSVYMAPSCMDDHVIGGDYGSGTTTGIYMGGPSCSVRNAVVWAHREGHGIHVVASSNQIFNTTVEGHAKHGIFLEGSHSAVVGCKIYANANAGEGYNDLYDGVHVNYGEHNLIASNIFYGKLGTHTSGNHRHHINIIGTQRITILGNSLRVNGNGEEEVGFVPVKGVYRSTDTDYSWLDGFAKGHIGSDLSVLGAAWTPVNWTMDRDVDGMVDANGWFRTKVYGNYKVDARIMLKGDSGGLKMLRVLYEDGREERISVLNGTAGQWLMLNGSTTLELNDDVGFKIEIYSASGETTFNGNSFTGVTIHLMK